jgi:hypothetical protein
MKFLMISPLEHTKVRNDFLSQGPYHAFRLFETANFVLNCVARLFFLRGSDLIGQLVMLLLYRVSGF